MAVAARIAGTVVHEATRATDNPGREIRIAMPSGVLTVAATVQNKDGVCDGRMIRGDVLTGHS